MTHMAVRMFQGGTMKKTIWTMMLAFALVAAFAVAGCAGNDASSETSPESAAEGAATSQNAAAAQFDTTASSITLKSGMKGGLQPIVVNDPEEYSASQAEEAERAIRSYTPPTQDSLLINEAPEFYYYSQLSGDAKDLYDAIVYLMEDPTTEDRFVSANVSAGTTSEDMAPAFTLASLAVLYDHPEFFWAYNGLETDLLAGVHDGTFYMALDKPYKNYEAEMTAFNDAVKDFLDDIDLDKSDAEVALAIHDKLIGMVTYDYDEAASSSTTSDFAHTAYGALVQNSSGAANTAVCDGYSQAYVYLLQQAGIEAAVLVGKGGRTEAEAENHAWAIVKLDGEWYEVDCTWDDSTDGLQQELSQLKAADPDNEAIPYCEEALADSAYCNILNHQMYNLTTSQISDFVPAKNQIYTFDEGMGLDLIGTSVHVRASDLSGFPGYDSLMELAPRATGTKYAFAA